MENRFFLVARLSRENFRQKTKTAIIHLVRLADSLQLNRDRGQHCGLRVLRAIRRRQMRRHRKSPKCGLEAMNIRAPTTNSTEAKAMVMHHAQARSTPPKNNMSCQQKNR